MALYCGLQEKTAFCRFVRLTFSFFLLFYIGVPRGTVRNAVGAGDSMVAGFLAGYLKLGTYSYALRMGAAAGSATAFSDELATKEEILKLLNTF